MEIPFGEADKLAKLVPEPVQGMSPLVREAIENTPELKQLYNESLLHRELLDLAASLERLNRNAGEVTPKEVASRFARPVAPSISSPPHSSTTRSDSSNARRRGLGPARLVDVSGDRRLSDQAPADRSGRRRSGTTVVGVIFGSECRSRSITSAAVAKIGDGESFVPPIRSKRMRQLLLISLIGCRSAAPPPVHHAAALLAAPAPPGVRPITQDVIDRLATERPFDEEAAGILRTDATPDWIGATIDDAFYPIVRLGNGRWAAAAEPLERGGRVKLERVFDASSLTQPAMGYVVSSYDGGSETGTERSTLHLVCADVEEVRACGSVEIGHFVWALAAEERRNDPGAATSLDKRPHVGAAADHNQHGYHDPGVGCFL